MANTTNLNLVKLSGSEKLKTYPTNQAGNMDTIDSAFGAGFGLSGNPSVNTSINNLADGLAIVANGNTHAAITSGQFVYVRNHGSLSEGLYVATANISANGTLSGSNLTADSSGGLNSVYSSLNSKLSLSNVTAFHAIEDSGHNLFILRGAYEGDGNFQQAIFNGNTKQIQIAKSVGGTETTIATFEEISNYKTVDSASNKTSHTINVPNDSLHFLIIGSTSNGLHGYGMVGATSAGVLNINSMQTVGITLTAGTGTITVDLGATARPLQIVDIKIRGSSFCTLS